MLHPESPQMVMQGTGYEKQQHCRVRKIKGLARHFAVMELIAVRIITSNKTLCHVRLLLFVIW